MPLSRGLGGPPPANQPASQLTSSPTACWSLIFCWFLICCSWLAWLTSKSVGWLARHLGSDFNQPVDASAKCAARHLWIFGQVSTRCFLLTRELDQFLARDFRGRYSFTYSDAFCTDLVPRSLDTSWNETFLHFLERSFGRPVTYMRCCRRRSQFQALGQPCQCFWTNSTRRVEA